jgi:hypothetical protein
LSDARSLRESDFFITKRSGLITGWIYLSVDWKYDLEDHKGCLVPGPDRDALMLQIYEKILPLIEEAEQQERHVALAKLAARLNECLQNVTMKNGAGWKCADQSAVRTAKEGLRSSRAKEHERSTSEINGANQDEAGDRAGKQNPMGGLSIGWFQDPEQRMLLQTKDEAGHLRVLFNTEHPEIAKATSDPANHFGLISTAMRSVSHLILEWTEERRKKTVPGFEPTVATTRVEAADALYSFLMRDLRFNRRGR